MARDIAFVFDTDYSMGKHNIKVADGKVIVKDKEFFVDQTKPITLRSGMGTKNVYFFKWNKLHAMGWKVNNGEEYMELGGDGAIDKELVPFEIKFGDEEGQISPELLRSTADMRFLKNMKSYAGGKGKGLGIENKGMFLVAIFIVVFVIVFLASYFYLGGFG